MQESSDAGAIALRAEIKDALDLIADEIRRSPYGRLDELHWRRTVLEAFVDIQTTLERLGEDMRRIMGAAP